MCQLKSPQRKRKQKTTVSTKPSRKTRTRRRRPKYSSLSLKLAPQNNPQTSKEKVKMTHKKKQRQQLNLFPLHPELNLLEDNKDMQEDSSEVASFLFDTATDSTTTLDGLLTTTATATTASEEEPRSTTYEYGGRNNSEEGHSNGLVRTAMRCKERDASEETWVSYSEVVESKKVKEEEGSSCVDDDDDDDDDDGAGAWSGKQVQVQKRRMLLDLKLDYQEVMNAWSDKGPLYVNGGSPQTVPELQDSNMPMDPWNLWSVPEMSGYVGSFKVDDELGCKEVWKRSEHREASVLRYKEKRRNRLFSKRIRYEVRKLNAEKRPRMKGRFVKRNSEE